MKKPLKYQILLDFDVKERELAAKFDQIAIVKHIIRIIRINGVKIKQTNNGFHVYLDITSKKPLTSNHICNIQALMGSDYKRESFNFLRVFSKIKNWNVLFMRKWETKYKGKRVLTSQEKARPDLEGLLIKRLRWKK